MSWEFCIWVVYKQNERVGRILVHEQISFTCHLSTLTFTHKKWHVYDLWPWSHDSWTTFIWYFGQHYQFVINWKIPKYKEKRVLVSKWWFHNACTFSYLKFYKSQVFSPYRVWSVGPRYYLVYIKYSRFFITSITNELWKKNYSCSIMISNSELWGLKFEST